MGTWHTPSGHGVGTSSLQGLGDSRWDQHTSGNTVCLLPGGQGQLSAWGHLLGGSTVQASCIQVGPAHQGWQHLGNGHGLLVVVGIHHGEGLVTVPIPWGVELPGGLQRLWNRWEVE